MGLAIVRLLFDDFGWAKLMRIFASLTVAIISICFIETEDCNAQLLRGLFNRSSSQVQTHRVNPPIWKQSAGHIGSYVPQDYSQPTAFPREAYFENRNPVISRILDGKMTHKYRDPVEVDSRYIGGFHQSHFQNIGIPSGDIGLRGNAYNWRTW